ncbi:uncharacterized protein LOC126892354 [Diabrotica virgifera virgifera]|uniref:Secreted protein n=1 Tax=Diabrotica virgifera virgifera TaxID=50390 RepID=A0ABM5L5W5_DIAVI|nr:uncharacterized protein LOC126892354 [Diabrotica virgifera virgifera]
MAKQMHIVCVWPVIVKFAAILQQSYLQLSMPTARQKKKNPMHVQMLQLCTFSGEKLMSFQAVRSECLLRSLNELKYKTALASCCSDMKMVSVDLFVCKNL